jgi:uncharacterized protein YgbK (DUF1537 family)
MTDSAPRQPLVVLDDDPTGTQAVAGVPVLLEWDAGLVAAAADDGARAVHLLTNSRAYPPERAYAVARDAAEAAVTALGNPRIAMRGDSTLRAHLVEEYRAVSDAVYAGRTPPLLLVPALPHAGRVTVGGVHLLERDGRRTPLHETEYAADPLFGYRDARLLRWAEERSDGFFAASAGREVGLEELRADGPDAVSAELLALAGNSAPAVCVPDAETLADLETIAQGLRLAEEVGAEILVRCAPAFVGVYAGSLARGRVPPPREGRPLLVVCGSWIASSTRQLAALVAAHPGVLVEVDAALLASSAPQGEVERAVRAASDLLANGGLAVVATTRARPAGSWDFEAGQRVAVNLAQVAARVHPPPAVVLAKGGITSHVTAQAGLGAKRGMVVGPLVDGVALWTLEAGQGRQVAYVVFPGNVGTDTTLLEVVGMIAGG